jgi:translation initiation factor 3 subunit G
MVPRELMLFMNKKMSKNWADLDDEVVEPQLPPTEITIDEKGIKTVVEYRKEDDKLLKITRQYRTVTRVKKVSVAVAERAKWASFGKAASNVNSAQTIVSRDEIRIEKPGEDSSDKTVEKITEQLKKPQGLRRKPVEPEPVKEEPNPGKYIPPNRRFGNGDGGSVSGSVGGMNGGRRYDNTNTLKVYNLSEDAKEQDVRDLFRRFGQVTKVNLVKDRETGLSRGLAFVSFYNQRDADNAQRGLNGHGYDHLILSVEWADN